MASTHAASVGGVDLSAPDKDIDRHTCSRTVPLQVLNLSMSRCGTSSMKAALEMLGYKTTYHWFEIYGNIQDCDMWSEAFDAKYAGKGKPFGRVEFDKLLGHCMAITDAPANCFAEELVEAYPEAKVILVERDEDAWYKSFRSGIIEPAFPPAIVYLFQYLDPSYTGRLTALVKRWIGYSFGANTKEEMEAGARDHYRKHNARVKALVAKENLLMYELVTGWEPLCKFLNKPVPEAPFPALNDAQAMAATMVGVRARFASNAGRNVLRYGLVPLSILLAAIWLGRKG